MDLIPDLFTLDESTCLLQQGALRLDWTGYQPEQPEVIFTAIGAYQLEKVIKASERLREHKIPHSVVYMFEPGRFRKPRNKSESNHGASLELQRNLYPDIVTARIFVTHTRPEPILGALQPLNTGNGRTAALGFINRGGTLNVPGMLFVNRCTWAHILIETSRVLNMDRESLLSNEELAALDGKAHPEIILSNGKA